MSLYAEFIKERENIETLETEDGFITYNIAGKAVIIHNIYIIPDKRHDGVGHVLENQILVIAKEKGCTHAYGFICPTTRGSTYSLTILLKDGYKLDSCTNNSIVMVKQI